MANKAQAPLLKARGQRMGNNGYWGYDPDILKFIMKECGKAYSQEHLMLYLMGNQPGVWRCTTENVLEATGIADKASLSKVKKQLKERGWIDYDAANHITVLYDNIREQMRKGCSENQLIDKETMGCSENYPQGCSQNQLMGCSQNNHNNINNNIYNNIKEDFSEAEAKEDKFVF